MSTHRIGALALVAGSVLLGTGPARAVESYDSCTGFIDALPAVIATQGTWCLRKDLATGINNGSAITISANNVAIDCNGFKLGGLSAGPSTFANGIQANDRINVTIRNCNVRGFRQGVSVFGGGGHLFEDNRFDGNTYIALASSAADNLTLRRNEVFDTGGGASGTTAVGIFVQEASSCAITDNTVAGVSPLMGQFEGSYPTGLQVGCDGAEVRANRVSGLVAEGAGLANGIRTFGTGNRIVDNFVHGSGIGTTGSGISGEGPLTLCQRNVVTGMQFGIEYCEQADNQVLSIVF